MVTLHTIDGGTVDAINDALLYDFIIGQNGIATGATVTSEGALLLHIDSGWGVIKGRIFSIEAETISATPSKSGTVNGRLILQIDITNTINPITFVTQAAATLPALQQEDINNNGTIFQLPIATYDVNEVAVSNLQMVAPVVEAIKGRIDSARSASLAAQGTADTALNNQKSAVLWENNEVSSTFTGKKINIDFKQYKILMILFEREAGYPNDIIPITTFVSENERYYTHSINSAYIYMRSFLMLSDGILFDNALEVRTLGSYGTNNNNLIPYKVIGILK